MKKLVFFAALLFGVTALAAQSVEGVVLNEDGFYEVWTAQQLKSVIQTDTTANVQLMDNIDAAKIGTLCGTFKGTLTGKHKVYEPALNKEVDMVYAIVGSNRSDYEGDHTDTWLFDRVEDATIEYIQFMNYRLSHEGGTTGLIAREAVNTTFSNLNFDHISIFEEDDYAGVIAGTATLCTFNGISSKFSDVTVDGCRVGGLVGASIQCEFTLVVIAPTSAVYADGSAGDAIVGGLVGESDRDRFVACMNSGLVGGGADDLGGMAGRSNRSDFNSCSNTYAVLFCDDEGSDEDKLYFRDLVDQTRQKVIEIEADKEEFNEKLRTLSMVALTGVASTVVGTVAADLLIWSTDATIMAVSGYNCIATMASSFHVMPWNLALAMGDAGYYAVNSAVAAAGFCIGIVVGFVAAVAVETIIILTDYDNAGGICGNAVYCDFLCCTNQATLYCDDAFCGGIAGFTEGGSINNCLNTGKIYNDGSGLLGGIVGGILNQTKITNCLSTQSYPIVGSEDEYWRPSEAHAASGNNYRRWADGANSNCFSWLETQVMGNVIGGGEVANWLNNGIENRELVVKPWRQNLRKEGADDNPVLDITHDEVLPVNMSHMTIRNEDDLRRFARYVNEESDVYMNAVLENDIVITSGQEWTPIGNDTHLYQGVFDGQGHTISGLKCHVTSGSSGAGLFGTVDIHADIRNVIIGADCEIENQNNYGAGGIVGFVKNMGRQWGTVNIRNCGNYGQISGNGHVGGILGRVMNNTSDSHVEIWVDNCFNAGAITADNNSALLCGYMKRHGVVTNCWSKGSLNRSASSSALFSMQNPTGEAEYFVGYDDALDIRNCYNTMAQVDWGTVSEDNREQSGVVMGAPARTVTFNAGSGYPDTTQLKEIYFQAGVELPDVESLADWTFEGWSGWLVSDTETRPATVGGAGDTFYPDFNSPTMITLYALFSHPMSNGRTLYTTTAENVVVSVSTAQFATLYYSYLNLIVPEGLEALTYHYDGGSTVEPVIAYPAGTVIPQREGVVLHATENLSQTTTFNFAITRLEAVKDANNKLDGSDSEYNITLTNDDYLYRLINGSHGVGFYRSMDVNHFTNAPHKAFLVVQYDANASGQPEGVAEYQPLLPTDKPTAIPTVNAPADGVFYNLMGQRVSPDYRGIVIVNGKKMLL